MPVWRLMGGPHRERQRVYWSHCATYRVENWELFRVKPLRTMQDVADCAREAAAKGYTALKTNIIWPGDPPRRITQGRMGPHDQLASRDVIDQAVAQIGAMREAVGPKVDICLDVNVNFKPSEALLLARALAFNCSGWRSTPRTPLALVSCAPHTHAAVGGSSCRRCGSKSVPERPRSARSGRLCWQGSRRAEGADLAQVPRSRRPPPLQRPLSTFRR